MKNVRSNCDLISWRFLLLCLCMFSAAAMGEDTLCSVCKCRESDIHCTGLPDNDILHSYNEEPVSALFITHSFLKDLNETDLYKFCNVSQLNIQYSDLHDNDNLFHLFEEVTEIDLRNNSLTRISADTFSTNEKLLSLDLRNNKIKSIEKNAFLHLTSLSILTLSGNEIERLENDTFAGLSELTELDLSGNRLKELEGATFAGLDNLNYLVLSGNQLRTFVVTSELQLLSNLDLSDNNFETLTFKGFWMLQNLVVSNNHIKELKDDSLVGLNELSLLDLSRNSISEVEELAFFNLTALEVLDLSDNLLETLEDNTFTSLSSLSLLDLSGNSLRSVSGALLEPLEALDELHLEDNEIRSINSEVAWLITVPELKSFLRGNPFVCMCDTLGAAYGVYLATALSPASSLDIFCDGDESTPWSDVIPALNCPEIDDYEDSRALDDDSASGVDLENSSSEDNEEDGPIYEKSNKNIMNIDTQREETSSGNDGDEVGSSLDIEREQYERNVERIRLEEDIIQTVETDEVVIAKMQRFNFKIHIIVLVACSFAMLSMAIAVVMSFLYRKQVSKHSIKTPDSGPLLP